MEMVLIPVPGGFANDRALDEYAFSLFPSAAYGSRNLSGGDRVLSPKSWLGGGWSRTRGSVIVFVSVRDLPHS